VQILNVRLWLSCSIVIWVDSKDEIRLQCRSPWVFVVPVVAESERDLTNRTREKTDQRLYKLHTPRARKNGFLAFGMWKEMKKLQKQLT
jgi:hypothetical protein